jgi:hypothetical protein
LRHLAVGEFAHLELDFVGLTVVGLLRLLLQFLGMSSVDDCGSQSCLSSTCFKRGPDLVLVAGVDDQRVNGLTQRLATATTPPLPRMHLFTLPFTVIPLRSRYTATIAARRPPF